MALRGVKVLECAGLAPGPFCGMILSDFGATVIRIDKIFSNADLDSLGHGKKSIAINLKDEAGINIFKRLCKSSDVLLEPFRKGTMENLGLGPDVLMKENPRLIYARLTGYGQTGPYSHKAGHDLNYLALTGLLPLFGRKGEKPTFPGNMLADFGGGGLLCALGIILALYEREKSGLGQIIDNSMVNSTAYLGSWFYRSQQYMNIWGKPRGENMLDSGVHFYDVYETKDKKYLSVACVETQFYNELLKGLELSDETAPQHYESGEIKALFTEKFKQKTLNEWLEIFEKLDGCVAPVLNLNEAPLFPHNVEQRAFGKDGEHFYPNPSPKLSRTPGVKSCNKRPQKGEHTLQILKEIEYSNEEIEILEAQGVIETYKPSKL